MVVEPRPWSGVRTGGYLTIPSSIMKTRHSPEVRAGGRLGSVGFFSKVGRWPGQEARACGAPYAPNRPTHPTHLLEHVLRTAHRKNRGHLVM